MNKHLHYGSMLELYLEAGVERAEDRESLYSQGIHCNLAKIFAEHGLHGNTKEMLAVGEILGLRPDFSSLADDEFDVLAHTITNQLYENPITDEQLARVRNKQGQSGLREYSDLYHEFKRRRLEKASDVSARHIALISKHQGWKAFEEDEDLFQIARDYSNSEEDQQEARHEILRRQTTRLMEAYKVLVEHGEKEFVKKYEMEPE